MPCFQEGEPRYQPVLKFLKKLIKLVKDNVVCIRHLNLFDNRYEYILQMCTILNNFSLFLCI